MIWLKSVFWANGLQQLFATAIYLPNNFYGPCLKKCLSICYVDSIYHSIEEKSDVVVAFVGFLGTAPKA